MLRSHLVTLCDQVHLEQSPSDGDGGVEDQRRSAVRLEILRDLLHTQLHMCVAHDTQQPQDALQYTPALLFGAPQVTFF